DFRATGIRAPALAQRAPSDVRSRRISLADSALAHSSDSCALTARREDRSAHLAELDVAGTAPEHDLVSVFEEAPGATVPEPELARPVPCQLDERALGLRLRARDRPGSEQVARPNRRSVRRRMGELLRHRPVETPRVRPRDDRPGNLDLELDVERPLAGGAEIRQRLGVLLGACDETVLEEG